jgi:hypothetical protein
VPNPNPVSGVVVDGGADDLSPPVKVGGVDGSSNVQTILLGTDGAQVIGGGVASGATDSGNPIKVGGRYNSTKPTLTDGQRGDIQLGSKGAVAVQLMIPDSGFPVPSISDVDGVGVGGAIVVFSRPTSFNGTTWDRVRGNQDNVTAGITASGVTTTQTGADQTNYNSRGLHVVLDMTAVGTGSVTLEIDGKDPVSGKYYAILTGAAVITNSTNVYKVYPGITAAANISVSDILPRTWRIKVTANNANATTYTVGAMLVV